jgi:hypothetical protein
MAQFLVEIYTARCHYCWVKFLIFELHLINSKWAILGVVPLLYSKSDIPSLFTAICGGISRVALYRDLSESRKERIWNQQVSFPVDSADFCIRKLKRQTEWQLGTA